jgi:hypothetical protein
VISDNQLDFIRKKIDEIEHGKITIVIQDGCAKIDILTEKRERVLRKEGAPQMELIEGGPPCKVRTLRPVVRINNRQDEAYLTRTAKKV